METRAYARTAVTRRLCLSGFVSACAILAGSPRQIAKAQVNRTHGFRHEDVVDRARLLADQPFVAEVPDLPLELRELTYDSYRAIRFRSEEPLWQGSGDGYQLHPFHLGFLYRRPVEVIVVTNGYAVPLPFRPDLFQYGQSEAPRRAQLDLGFAGFALTTTLNDQRKQDEFVSFLGASYFRFLGREQHYGLSARALALDVGGEKAEEFPFFRALWIEKPEPDAVQVVIHALLDSPSVAGAYRFTVVPGRQTIVHVEATLLPRVTLVRPAIAPLTSMYFLGEADRQARPDFRPEIHDSDGLMLRTGSDEWIWRPLRNPDALSVSQFMDASPKGFGLMQRDRSFAHYQDLEAHYHQRPGYWVEPEGDWGRGRIELVEIPTDNEAMDNIVAFWTPEAALEAGRTYTFRYRLSTVGDTAALHQRGQARHSFGPLRQEGADGGFRPDRRYIVDFSGGNLAHFLTGPDKVEAVATTSAGTITMTNTQPHPPLSGFRAVVDVSLPSGAAGDLRLYLRARGRTLTETWTMPLSEPARVPVSDGLAEETPHLAPERP